MGFRKGQAAIEYLAVFGLALALSTPFIVNVQTSLQDLESSSNAIAVQNSLQKLETSVNTVSASGEPAQRTFEFEVPSNVESAEVLDYTVRYKLRTRSGTTDIIKTFESSIEGDLPVSRGVYQVTVYAEDDKTFIEVVGN